MTPGDLEALDRLEQKVRLLVAEMGKLRADHASRSKRTAASRASSTRP